MPILPLAFAAVVGSATVLTEQRLADVEAYVRDELQAAHIPGAAFAIVTRDKGVVLAKGYGLADPSGTPVGPDTPFQIGSLSKSFTALATLQLVESGKVELDAPVQRYVPSFRLADREASTSITVRHLLNQTSGLSWDAGCLGATPTPRLETLAAVKPASVAGRRFEYCNANYDLLALVIEAASQRSYGDTIRHAIFEPLEMRHSFVDPREALENALAWGHRDLFGIAVGTRDVFSPSIAAAGGLSASASDMGRYLFAHLDGGVIAGRGRLASEALMSELYRTPGAFSSYGMGWRVRRISDRPALLHTGVTKHFTSTMVMSPDKGLGFVILTNLTQLPLPRFELPVESIAFGSMRMLSGEEHVPATAGGTYAGRALARCALLLGVIGLLAHLIWRVRRWRAPSTWAKVAASAAFDLGIGAFLLAFSSRLLDFPMSVVLHYAPDIGWALLVGVGVAATRLALRLVLAWRARPRLGGTTLPPMGTVANED
jgi:CubicO group peptidase (beta-lactamase class C family)